MHVLAELIRESYLRDYYCNPCAKATHTGTETDYAAKSYIHRTTCIDGIYAGSLLFILYNIKRNTIIIADEIIFVKVANCLLFAVVYIHEGRCMV